MGLVAENGSNMKRFKADGTKKEDVVAHPRFPAHSVREVWLNVLSKLHPEDKPAFFRAVPEWHDEWMASKSTQFLIPEVAPILWRTLPNKSLLQSRLLCKTWTNELDTHFENHGVNLHLPFEIAFKQNKHQSHPIPKHIYNFTSTERIQEFLQLMGTHTGNPFLWGNIELQWISYGEPLQRNPETIRLCTEYWNNAILLLNQFGRHVLNISIDFTDSTPLNGLELARIFRSLVVQLPNLKGLRMWGTALRHTLMIQTYLRRNPLPLLQNLEMVDTHCEEMGLICAVLNRCNPSKIKRLKLDGFSKMESTYPDLFCSFLNLEVLNMPDLKGLQILGNLEVVPPLREVKLKGCYRRYNLEEVFAALQPFRNTIVRVVTDQAKKIDNREGVRTRSRCARRNENETVVPPKDFLDFYEFEKDMSRSNIWELFPFLASIKVGIHSREFNRNDYKRFKNANSISK